MPTNSRDIAEQKQYFEREKLLDRMLIGRARMKLCEMIVELHKALGKLVLQSCRQAERRRNSPQGRPRWVVTVPESEDGSNIQCDSAKIGVAMTAIFELKRWHEKMN
jgi:hypothetical protein